MLRKVVVLNKNSLMCIYLLYVQVLKVDVGNIFELWGGWFWMFNFIGYKN